MAGAPAARALGAPSASWPLGKPVPARFPVKKNGNVICRKGAAGMITGRIDIMKAAGW